MRTPFFFGLIVLEFGDSNSLWFNPKSLRCDICDEVKIMKFFNLIFPLPPQIPLGVRSLSPKYGLILLITLIYIHTYTHMYIYIYENDDNV